MWHSALCSGDKVGMRHRLDSMTLEGFSNPNYNGILRFHDLSSTAVMVGGDCTT